MRGIPRTVEESHADLGKNDLAERELIESLKPGDIVAGKYLLEHVIGRGGIGVIASAQHLVLRQRVALKFLRPELSRQPDVVLRFLREAQAVAQIRGEHVARIMDAGTIETGEAFFVMEYLEGRDLAAVLLEDGPLTVEDAVDYVVQACEALAEAHALGIVHRDLKPANLFLTRAPDGSPFVKVLDFGLSKLAEVVASESLTELTADHHILGSPHFMSPEQMRSARDADARSDVWALGAVLYTLLAGRVPFDGKYLTEICAAVLDGRVPSLCDLRPDVSEELNAVVARCLRTQREDRFESIACLALALARCGAPHVYGRAERISRVLVAGRSLETRGDEPERAPLTPRSMEDGSVTRQHTPSSELLADAADSPRTTASTPTIPLRPSSAGLGVATPRAPITPAPTHPSASDLPTLPFRSLEEDDLDEDDTAFMTPHTVAELDAMAGHPTVAREATPSPGRPPWSKSADSFSQADIAKGQQVAGATDPDEDAITIQARPDLNADDSAMLDAEPPAPVFVASSGPTSGGPIASSLFAGAGTPATQARGSARWRVALGAFTVSVVVGTAALSTSRYATTSRASAPAEATVDLPLSEPAPVLPSPDVAVGAQPPSLLAPASEAAPQAASAEAPQALDGGAPKARERGRGSTILPMPQGGIRAPAHAVKTGHDG